MDLKKSIFSYIVWAAFAPLCCLGVFFSLERAGIREMFGIPLIGMVGGVCVYLLFTAAVFFALRTICAEIGRHIPKHQKTEAVLSVVLPVIVLIGIVVYLVLYLVYHTPLTLEEEAFYRQALVSDGKDIAFFVHGASWLYTCLLHGMLLIFGNTPFAGVVLQIVLFFICLLLLYVGMQAFTGTIPAAFSMALFGFLPVSFQYVFSLTPELFYLALYLSGFSLTGNLYKKYRQREASSSAQHMEDEGSLQNMLSFVSVFLLGLYIGFLIYLDISGISLYLFLAVSFSAGKDKIRQAVSYFASVFDGICGFFLSAIVICQIEKTAVFAYLQELYSLYVSEMKFEAKLSRFISFLPDVTTGGSILIISLAFCIIPAFFLWKKSQGSAFIVNLFLMCGLSGFSAFPLDAQMITTLAWIMLAGLGVYSVVRAEEGMEEIRGDAGAVKDTGNSPKKAVKKTDKKSRQKKAESKEKAISESAKAKDQVISEESAKAKDQVISEGAKKEEKTVPKSSKAEKKAAPENVKAKKKRVPESAKAEEKAVSESDKANEKAVPEKSKNSVQIYENQRTVIEAAIEKKEQEKPAPGEPLHNPLPVPKRKSRPQVDFGYQVTDAKMKFDLDVADDDDFDW